MLEIESQICLRTDNLLIESQLKIWARHNLYFGLKVNYKVLILKWKNYRQNLLFHSSEKQQMLSLVSQE